MRRENLNGMFINELGIIGNSKRIAGAGYYLWIISENIVWIERIEIPNLYKAFVEAHILCLKNWKILCCENFTVNVNNYSVHTNVL